ncbi:MAG: hypothetical protein ACFNLN_03855 [Treponema socranskii subsp. buccale]|jgi:hypothetical protein|uniref:hypothetical protein n=1 Tax=Treponema socranskii TaxID=53419 RepID=UPI0028E53C47|nr:hypothetical protein [Treponema socranskii]
MDTKKIDDLPDLVQAGTLSKEEAVKKIAEYIFREPYRFGLAGFDDDFKSEIILTVLQKGAQVFKRFDKNCGAFGSYLYAFVRGLILTQKREAIRKFIADSNMKAFSYPEDSKRTDESLSFIVAEPKVRYAPVSNTKIWKALSRRCNATNAGDAKTALILALKSSYYIPASSVDEVSSYCKLQSAELQRLIAELNSLLYSRIERRNTIVRRRDNAYYFHRKYYMQLKLCDKEKTDTELLLKKYRKQTESWKHKNKELRESRWRVCPTNKMIANILGICERQVSHYITRAQKLIREKERKTETTDIPE